MTEIRKDVAECLALLSPGALRWDVGGGGGGIDGRDVAQALATVKTRIGAHVLVLRGNPDFAKISRENRHYEVYIHALREAEDRLIDALKARIRGRPEPRKPFPAPEFDYTTGRCEQYWRIAQVCLTELADTAGARWTARGRARLMKVDESTWRRSWADVYGWLWDECINAEAEAKRQLAHALSNKLRGTLFLDAA